MSIGERIKSIILERNITMKELSRKTSIPYTTLVSSLKRDTNYIQTEHLNAIANALGVSSAYLILGYDPSERNNEISEEVLKIREKSGKILDSDSILIELLSEISSDKWEELEKFVEELSDGNIKADEESFITIYRQLNEYNKGRAYGYISGLLEHQE